MDKVMQNGIDIISPIALGGAFENVSSVIDSIVWQHENYGINKFMVSAPSKGWRSMGYPDPEHFKECARAIRKIRIATEKYGIEMPISNEVYRVIFEGRDVKECASALMGRSLKSETYFS